MTAPPARSLLANASANTLVGLAGLAYAALVPAVVVRGFGPTAYGSWYLAFQISTYVLVLDLGSQIIVSKEAAAPSKDIDAARLTTAALLAQAGIAATTIALFFAVAAFMTDRTFSIVLILLGGAAASSLLASTIRAWFGGLRRAHVAVPWLVAARLGAVLGGGLGFALHVSLVIETVLIAAPQALIHIGFLRWSHRAPSPWSRPHAADLRHLLRCSAPLALWSVCGVLIGGVDVFIVKALDPRHLGDYSVALALIALPAGAVTAISTAWLPAISHAAASGRQAASSATTEATTALAGLLALGCIPFVAMAPLIVRTWAGPGRWGVAVTSLQILYVATASRYVFLPWVSAVVVAGQQRAVLLTPVVEALVNVAASIAGCVIIGAPGVALGTLVGALAAALINIGRNMSAAPAASMDPRGFLVAMRGAGVPFLLAAAACLTSAISGISPVSVGVDLLALGSGALWVVRSARLVPLLGADPAGRSPGSPRRR